MEAVAGFILAATGGLLVATDVRLYNERERLFHPYATIGFCVVLTIAYYLSLAVVLS